MLLVNKNPCTTCPYRKDVPSGVWAQEEYEKLRDYDREDERMALATFLCHQSTVAGRNMACKGWVMVHRESVAVRVACAKGQLDYRTCFEETDVELYESGNAAADAGERQIKRPGREAQAAMFKLKLQRQRKRRGRK